MARAFLVCSLVLANDLSEKVRKVLDYSIFEPKFTFD